jgi:hypothetical protein
LFSRKCQIGNPVDSISNQESGKRLLFKQLRQKEMGPPSHSSGSPAFQIDESNSQARGHYWPASVPCRTHYGLAVFLGAGLAVFCVSPPSLQIRVKASLAEREPPDGLFTRRAEGDVHAPVFSLFASCAGTRFIVPAHLFNPASHLSCVYLLSANVS